MAARAKGLRNPRKILSKDELERTINRLDEELAHEQRYSAGGPHITQLKKRLVKLLSEYDQQFGKRNPGAAWHRGEAKRFQGLMYKQGISEPLAHAYSGAWGAHWQSESESEKLGLPNPISGTCPLHGTRIVVNPGAKSVRCPVGSHKLNIPRR